MSTFSAHASQGSEKEKPASRQSRAQILSIVGVCTDGRGEFPLPSLEALHARLAGMGVAFEIVAVMNGCSPGAVSALRELADRLSNFQVYVLRFPVEMAIARLAGLENAIGDWVVTLDLVSDPPEVVEALFEAVTKAGADVADARSTEPAPDGFLELVLSFLFGRLFRLFHGFSLSEQVSSAKILSRALLNAALQHPSPLVAVEVLPALAGYRRAIVSYTRRSPGPIPLRENVRTRWRALISINAVPLRIANAACGLGAILSLAYSVYVVVIYLFKPDVMPGWTTVSLMLSAMFLMLSAVLWLLSEYFILVFDPAARRPHYEILSEFTSKSVTHRAFLNVDTEL